MCRSALQLNGQVEYNNTLLHQLQQMEQQQMDARRQLSDRDSLVRRQGMEIEELREENSRLQSEFGALQQVWALALLCTSTSVHPVAVYCVCMHEGGWSAPFLVWNRQSQLLFVIAGEAAVTVQMRIPSCT